MLQKFLSHWNVEELANAPNTNKVAYQVIAARKFQFRRLDYKQRSLLAIEAAGIIANINEVYQALSNIEEGIPEEELLVAIFPVMIKVLTNPRLHPVVEKLCSTASVDLGNGKFEPLSDDLVAETVFGDDLTLQVPVAVAATMVNFDGLMPFLAKFA
jgi:hypothetical protein